MKSQKFEIIKELVKRDIKARYKQSVLGYAWIVVVPLLNLVVLSLVFSFFIRIPTGGLPYQVFLFAGLVPWTFTANSISLATNSLVSNSSLITKIKLPREIFPISAILSKTLDFFLMIIILVGIMIYYKTPLSLNVLYLPLIFIVHLTFIIGVSFILSAINVFYRDVENMLSIFLVMWMYVTPVLYPQELIPDYLVKYFNINPMMPIVNAYRNVLVYRTAPTLHSFVYAIITSIFIFIIGYYFFKSKAKYFADVI